MFSGFHVTASCEFLLSRLLTDGIEGFAADRHILDWDETDVHTWLSSLGYPQYESQIRGMISCF
jgi:hypothetical protein